MAKYRVRPTVYYDFDGTPLDRNDPKISEWYEERNDDRQVARTLVDDADVSTVFLVIDHGFGTSPPLIFETMVFGGPHDQYCERYSNVDQARLGHAAVVKALQEGREPGPHTL